MRYMEIDYHCNEITIWVKDDQLQKAWVRTYNLLGWHKYLTPFEVLDNAIALVEKYGVGYIRFLSRVGSEAAYEYVKRHTAGRVALCEHYQYYDL